MITVRMLLRAGPFLGGLICDALVAQDLIWTLKPPWYTGGGRFSTAIAAAGDLDQDGTVDVLVGAPKSEPTGKDDQVGQVFCFSGATGEILFELNGEGLHHHFGRAVEGMPDLDLDGVLDFVVGAPQYGAPSNRIGRAYLYSGKLRDLLYERTGENSGDEFGHVFAALDDLTGDGIDEWIVGALSNDEAMTEAGKAYVYSGPDGALIAEFLGTQRYQAFGMSASAVGDLDGGGRHDFLIGTAENAAGGGIGRAFLYSGETLSLIKEIVATSPYSEDFGLSLSCPGDVNGDQVPDFLIGDPKDVERGSVSGRLYVYSGRTLLHLWSYYGEESDSLGSRHDGLGDLNMDGYADFVVGTSDNLEPGAVLIYAGGSGRLLYRFRGREDTFEFGEIVAGIGDIDHDGIEDLAAGDLQFNRAYVYSGNDLFLDRSRRTAKESKPLALFTRGGRAGATTALYLVDVDGAPAFDLLDVGRLGPYGERTLSGTVPPGLAGLKLGFRAYAQSGRNILDSAINLVEFE